MPKTEDELRNWVVEYNRQATHNRGLLSNYGYQSILDIDLVAICKALAAQFPPPIRVLDVGCGSGWALKQLAEQLDRSGLPLDHFELWGIGVNRYEEMWISDERFLHSGFNAYQADGAQFHLIFSVFAFHYFWHKLEAIEKIHNDLLVDGGSSYLHFPGYLIRFGESSGALLQNEADGNRQFQEFLQQLESNDSVCPMQYRLVPHYSDDDDCSLLAEFGHVRFQKTRETPICFGQALQAFGLFEAGFTITQMNASGRTYVASHYQNGGSAAARSGRYGMPPLREKSEVRPLGKAEVRAMPDSVLRAPYRISTLTIPAEPKPMLVDVAVHEHESNNVVVVCPGACEPLAGRVIEYAALARTIVDAGLGAVVRYSDPYDHEGNYAELLLEKLRQVIEFTLSSASHFCSTANPRLHLMAYSSSAGAAAALTAEYEGIESLLLIAPSYDVPHHTVGPAYRRFRGNVRVLIGESDAVVLPQQAFWYYEQAESAASREYVEVPCCGHSFEGPDNKSIFFRAPIWAFGKTRPRDFPPPRLAASDAW